MIPSSKNLQNILIERKRALSALADSIRKRLSSAPDGALRISRNKGKIQYYHRKNKADKTGSYISSKDKALIIRLAQKPYDRQILEYIHQELKAINSYLINCPETDPAGIYQKISEDRRSLITPIEESDSAFRARWETFPYTGLSFSDDYPELFTEKEERVRSKSEVIIANALFQADIPYRYECPLPLQSITVHPDFTVLNPRLRKVYYWEHLGMIGDAEYADSTVRKIGTYISNGIFPGDQLLLTMETNTVPLNIRHVKAIIAHFLI